MADQSHLNLLRWERHVTHVENLLSQDCNIFSVLSMFKCNPGKIDNKFVHFSVISVDEFKEKTNLLCIEFGRSLWSAISCQRKTVKRRNPTRMCNVVTLDERE